MLHVFGKHIGSTVEAYVDDIVVKSKRRGNLIQDLEIAFSCLRANQIKLNPEKCVFGVPRGMLLGYIVSQRGIEANPEKVSAITRMGPIRDVKGVQRVTGCLVSRVSIRGTLTDACNETIRTQDETLDSTLWPYTCAAIDGRSLEDRNSVERIDQGSSASYRRIRERARAKRKASCAWTLSAA